MLYFHKYPINNQCHLFSVWCALDPVLVVLCVTPFNLTVILSETMTADRRRVLPKLSQLLVPLGS